MNKRLTVMAGVLAYCLAACNAKPEGTLSEAAQKNVNAMHGITTAFESKDFSKLSDYMAADAVDHAGEGGDVKGLDSLRASFEREMASIGTMKTTLIKELADDEYVMSWYRFTGTYNSPSAGHKAGESFDLKALEVARFKEGKAVEHWTLLEPAEMMKEMSNMQPQVSAPGDAAKKK